MKTIVLLFALSFLVPASVIESDNFATQSQLETQLRVDRAEGLNVRTSFEDDALVSFSGTWKTIAGGTHQYTVTLKQTGEKVTGSYAPGNGKIFDGVVTDNKLTFKWTQDGGFEGTGEFTMDEDGKGFTGSSTALKPQELTNTWNTYKPEAASFAGNWETISDGQNSHTLTMVQSGNKVTGILPSTNGKLEGTVTGKVLRFKWESDSGSGSGRFVMEESTIAFNGTYNRGDDPDEVEATWNGTRKAYTGGKTPPASFAGEWNVTWKATKKMVLVQTGDRVRGFYSTAQVGGYDVKEGKVSGNKLRFTLVGAPVGNTIVGCEFVMDEGGKSFKGQINGDAVTGTFLRPANQ